MFLGGWMWESCARTGTSRAWEYHTQEVHVKGTTLNSGQGLGGEWDIGESSQGQLVRSPWAFQAAVLLAGEILVKYVLLDMCEAVGYRAMRGTVVSCPWGDSWCLEIKAKGCQQLIIIWPRGSASKKEPDAFKNNCVWKSCPLLWQPLFINDLVSHLMVI